MPRKFRRRPSVRTLLLAIVPLLHSALPAQEGPRAGPGAAALATRFAAMTAPSGLEQRMVDSLLALLPGAVRDRAGNAVLRIGSGTPRRLVACPLDEPGWVVGGIREDGWLTLRRLAGRAPAMFDQQLEAQQVTVWTRRAGRPGVVAVRSVHLTRGRSPDDAPFTFDHAFVDVGARTAAEARALGIRETDAVALTKRPHRYGDSLLAAPWAGRRAACAALVAAALGARPRDGAGETVVAFVVEQNLGRRGLLTAMNAAGPFAETVVLDAGVAPFASVGVERDTTRQAAGFGAVFRWRIPVRYEGSPVETVRLPDVDALAGRLAAWIGGPR